MVVFAHNDAPPSFGLRSVVEATDSDGITANAADTERKIPRGKSEAHFDLKDNKIVFLSLDLETGGEYCGIIQLSSQLFRQNPADWQLKTFIVVEETFNEYVPPSSISYVTILTQFAISLSLSNSVLFGSSPIILVSFIHIITG
jgi:hypothetical protein